MDTLKLALILAASGLVLSAFYVGYTTGRVMAFRASQRRFLARENYVTRMRIHHARHLRGFTRGKWGGQN